MWNKIFYRKPELNTVKKTIYQELSLFSHTAIYSVWEFEPFSLWEITRRVYGDLFIATWRITFVFGIHISLTFILYSEVSWAVLKNKLLTLCNTIRVQRKAVNVILGNNAQNKHDKRAKPRICKSATIYPVLIWLLSSNSRYYRNSTFYEIVTWWHRKQYQYPK